MPEWMQHLSEWVYREYDRRIKRASLITTYRAAHPGERAEDDAAKIVNVPRGTIVASPRAPDDPAQ